MWCHICAGCPDAVPTHKLLFTFAKCRTLLSPAPKASSATAKKCCRIVGPPRRERHLTNGGCNGVPAPLTPVLSGNRRGFYPPVERAVVRTFSIDKMRPVCPVCNPGGDTPYPTGFPQPRCVDDHGKGLNGGDPKNVRQNLIETAADIVHHRWDIDAANDDDRCEHDNLKVVCEWSKIGLKKEDSSKDFSPSIICPLMLFIVNLPNCT